MPKNEKEHAEDMLSFDELKDKVQPDTDETDPEVAALLDSLRDIEPPPEPAQTPAEEESSAEAAPETPSEAENYKSIYNDVLRSVMQNEQESEKTTRKAKFLSDESQFVDVTDRYEGFADLQKQPEADPPAAAAPAEATRETEAKAQTETEEAPAEEKQYRTFNEIFKSGLRKIFPNKRDTVGEGIRKVIVDLSVLALVACGVYFGVYAYQSHAAKAQQAEITGQIIAEDTVDSESDVWAEFFAQYPNIQLPEGMMAKYAYLYAINQDLVGWIRIPNSIVDVQVVQSEENGEYLKKDFYGNYSRYGCPYMDYRNDPKYLGQNTIIYGHHMSDGLVFADLTKYKTIEGFQESPIIQFDTLYRSYTFKVYAVLITNSQADDDNGYIFNYTVTDFGSDEKFMEYIAAVDERKLYTTGVDIQPDDKLITLQTCTYEFSDARLVVIGRMVRDGESTTVDTSLAVENASPRYPQAWYDKQGIANPYADAEKWMP